MAPEALAMVLRVVCSPAGLARRLSSQSVALSRSATSARAVQPLRPALDACCSNSAGANLPVVAVLQVVAEKTKEVTTKSWSFLKTAYAAAASTIEQTAAQQVPATTAS